MNQISNGWQQQQRRSSITWNTRKHISVQPLQLRTQHSYHILIRSFLKRPGHPNIPIQAIGLSLYEQLAPSTTTPGTSTPTDTDVETPGTVVTRTQWLDLSSLEMANLIGKNVLIVDEVDDTRTTLEYAVRELQKDVEAARELSGRTGEDGKTRFSIFVLHNKDKVKRGKLPEDMVDENRYMAAVTLPD
jgi:hypoxanthine phosphoribosyltransferase